MAAKCRDCRSHTMLLFPHLCQECSIELHAPAQQEACPLLALKWPVRLVLGFAAVLDSRGKINSDLLASNAARKGDALQQSVLPLAKFLAAGCL